MPEDTGPLAGVRSVVLIDWPSREVPDTLARSGLAVVSNDGPDEYNAYELVGDEVRVRKVDGLPKRADLVYTHRPIDELPEIVDAAKTVGATAVWIHGSRRHRCEGSSRLLVLEAGLGPRSRDRGGCWASLHRGAVYRRRGAWLASSVCGAEGSRTPDLLS